MRQDTKTDIFALIDTLDSLDDLALVREMVKTRSRKLARDTKSGLVVGEEVTISGSNRIESGKIKEFDVSYFVRNLELNTNLNFDILEREALKQEKITIVPFGRIKGRSILSRDFFRISSNLIRECEYALIEEVR